MADHGLSYGGATLPVWAANLTLMGPASGAAAVPTLRAPVTGDVTGLDATLASIATAISSTITITPGTGLTGGGTLIVGAGGAVTVAIGDAELLAIAGLTSAADKLAYFTGSGTAALTDLSAFARTILDDANAAAVRTTIGAGTSSFSGAFGDLSGIPTTLAGYGIVDAQPLDTDLTSIAALGSAADKGLYTTAAHTWAEFALTAAARTVLDDATVAAMVDNLGGASSTGTGGLARATSPTFVTPTLGTPAGGTLTNCTGHTFANLASKPTTIAGYGITDAETVLQTGLATGTVTGVTAKTTIFTYTIAQHGLLAGQSLKACFGIVRTGTAAAWTVRVEVDGTAFESVSSVGSTGTNVDIELELFANGGETAQLGTMKYRSVVASTGATTTVTAPDVAFTANLSTGSRNIVISITPSSAGSTFNMTRQHWGIRGP